VGCALARRAAAARGREAAGAARGRRRLPRPHPWRVTGGRFAAQRLAEQYYGQSIKVPACVIPGNDRTHAIQTGRTLARLLPRAELHELYDHDEDLDIVPPEEWQKKDGEITAIFTRFLKRMETPASAARA
jgi:hypothetical protein